jgi:hypothetical protein
MARHGLGRDRVETVGDKLETQGLMKKAALARDVIKFP